MQYLPIFRQIFATKFGRGIVSLEFGSLSKKCERICRNVYAEEYRLKAFRSNEKNIFKFEESEIVGYSSSSKLIIERDRIFLYIYIYNLLDLIEKYQRKIGTSYI